MFGSVLHFLLFRLHSFVFYKSLRLWVISRSLSPLTPDSPLLLLSPSISLSRSPSLPLPLLSRFSLFICHRLFRPSFPPVPRCSTPGRSGPFELLPSSAVRLSVRPSIHSIYPTSPCFPPHFSISCLFLLFTRENSGPNLLSVSPSFSRVERRERAHFPRPQSHFALGLCRGEKRGIFGSQLGPRTPPTSTAAKKSVVRSRSVHRRCRRRAAGHME